MPALISSLWSEPPPPLPTSAPWADRALAALLLPVAVVEGVVRDDVPARPLAIACALFLVGVLPWRRAHAAAVFFGAFGLVAVVNIVAFVKGVSWDGLYVNAVILLLPYSLFRWGAGRAALLGLFGLALVYVSSATTDDMKNTSDRIGAAVVLALPAALGATARFRAAAQRQELETVRARERERLARDLHDTVAHHVTAIVLQAQGGQLVVGSKPDAAKAAFAAIEGEASRALRELRALVGVLRDGDAPLSPQPGLADVVALAGVRGGVVVGVDIDAVAVDTVTASAIFRIAQEAVTNAVRHAREAQRITVRVSVVDGGIGVCVDDDGAASASTPATGYGLTGMAERAALLGGTCQAGPRADGGWRVEAVFPQRGSA